MPLPPPMRAALLNVLRYAVYVLIIPFVFIVTELFVLPVDFYGFRSWESIRPYDEGQSYGPFYPNIHTLKNSAGDQFRHGKKTRVIDWITDRYGFRNQNADGPFDVIVTGDSYIGGAHLKQEETLSSVLAKKCHCRVYNYGAISFPMVKKLLVDGRFKGDARPKYWIIEVRPHVNFLSEKPDFSPLAISDKPISFNPMTPEEVLEDRFKKLAGFNFLYSYMFDRIHLDISKLQVKAKAMKDTGNREFPYAVPADKTNNFEQADKLFNSLDAAARHTGMIPIYLIAPWPDRRIDPFIAKLAKTHKIIYFGPGSGLPIDPNDPIHFRFQEDSHWRPATVEAAAGHLSQCLDGKPTCTHMPPIELPPETEESKSGSCIYDDKLYANGTQICSGPRIMLTCQIPPKDKQEELGRRLQWMSLTSDLCG